VVKALKPPHFASTYRLKKVKGSYTKEASLRLGRVDTDYDEGVDGFNIYNKLRFTVGSGPQLGVDGGVIYRLKVGGVTGVAVTGSKGVSL